MLVRLSAPALCAALALLAGSGPAVGATAKPSPKPTPLKTIKHVYSTSRLCTGLRRSVGPAVGRVLQNDKTIATSRPLFQDFVKNSATSSEGGKQMDVERLEGLISPLVNNTQAIEQLLNDPIFARKPANDNDKQLLLLRAHLEQILAEQKRALDLVSGFVDTEQLGQLQSEGHQYDSAITGTGTTQNQTKPSTSPTTAPDPILNAGIHPQDPNSDPATKNDPRLQSTGNQLGYNPLNAFDQQMFDYQAQIAQSESLATLSLMKAIPICGGHLSAPSPAPSPIAPLPLPTATP